MTTIVIIDKSVLTREKMVVTTEEKFELKYGKQVVEVTQRFTKILKNTEIIKNVRNC